MEEAAEVKKRGRPPKIENNDSTASSQLKKSKPEDNVDLFNLFKQSGKEGFTSYVKSTYLSNGLHPHLVELINSFYEELMTSDSIDEDEKELFKMIADLINNHLTKRSALVSHKFSIDNDN
jgi:hypothetical protein